MSNRIVAACAAFLLVLVSGPSSVLAQPKAGPKAAAQAAGKSGVLRLPGLKASAKIIRDVDGLAHVQARNEHDMVFLQGWVHAEDRLFQLDVNRRQPSGTLAELLGPAVLPSDVQLRTIGLRRSAERTWAAVQADARAGDKTARAVEAALYAYADGVNAYVDAAGGVLPPE